MKTKLALIGTTMLMLVTVTGCSETTIPATPISSAQTSSTNTEPASDVDQTLVRSVLAVLITAKEKNYGKQYDILVCKECKNSITKEEYIKAWTSEFEDVTLQTVTMPEDSSIKEIGNKAEIQPVYKLSDVNIYTPKNPNIKTLKFVKEQDGIWKLNWSK